MSSSTFSLVGLSRSGAVAALARWRPLSERGDRADRADLPADATPAAAPSGRLQRLTQAVQAVVAPPEVTEAAPANAPVAAAANADPLAQAGLGADDNTAMAQRFAEAVLLALHDSAKRRDDDDDDHGRGHHRGHRHDGEHDHGVRAYRGMDRLASRLQDLAGRLRAGEAGTPAAPAATTPTTDTDPLPSLVQAFTALAPQARGSDGAQALSPRERLATFLDRLAALLAEPRRRLGDEGSHPTGRGQLLNLTA